MHWFALAFLAHWRSRLLMAGLAAFLAGCTVGPDFHAPKAPATPGYTAPGETNLPTSSTSEATQHLALGKKISSDWWQLFHAPGLDRVLRQAIANNRNRATLAEAREAVSQVTGAIYPQVNISSTAVRQRFDYQAFGMKQPSQVFNLYSIAPSVSYALDVFGGTRRLIEQQAALAQYQDDQLTAAYLTLTGNTVTQAITIAAFRAQVKAVQDILADDEENLRLVQQEVAVGMANRLDIETATSQLENDRTLLPPLAQQLSVARHALSILVGKAPADWAPPEFDLSSLALPGELPVSLPSKLVRQRPDILAAEARLHAASAAIGVATAQLYPSLTLSASLTQEALQPDKIFHAYNNAWSLGLNLMAPIFHGGALEAQRRGAIDAFKATLATYEQTVLQSFGQVADILQALAHDSRLMEAQRRALDSAAATLDLTRRTYAVGNVGILQLLEAQRLLEQARLGYVRAEAQRYVDTAQLFVAMGGGWGERQAITAVSE
jgi:NodT family efflux transporter outer membrane factor (OMF) lipoprotein